MPWHRPSPRSGSSARSAGRRRISTPAFVVAFADALSAAAPRGDGACSIGGRVVLNLAATHADRFRALIGLQASAHVAPYYGAGWLHHADVHGGEVCAASYPARRPRRAGRPPLGNPLALRAGPWRLQGDLHFYKVDGDLRRRIASIDASRCPLFLLTGEYDYSCSPAETEEVAALIPGARCTIMPGLGHFPMSEDPRALSRHLRPVLLRNGGHGKCRLVAASPSHFCRRFENSPRCRSFKNIQDLALGRDNLRASCMPFFDYLKYRIWRNCWLLTGLESRYAILQLTRVFRVRVSVLYSRRLAETSSAGGSPKPLNRSPFPHTPRLRLPHPGGLIRKAGRFPSDRPFVFRVFLAPRRNMTAPP